MQSPTGKEEFLSELKDVFTKFSGGADKMPASELAAALRLVGQYLTSEQVQELTRDAGDAGLTFDEFESLYATASDLNAADQDIMEGFMAMDDNRTGFISAAQFKTMLMQVLGLQESEADDVIEAARMESSTGPASPGSPGGAAAAQISYDFVAKFAKQQMMGAA